jgi:probable rRNA maturation factor
MINFINLSGEQIDTASLRTVGRKILSEEGIEAREEINCIFTDDNHIKELNAQYRAKPVPTDVLAFSFTEGEDVAFRERLFGDIYISVEMAKRNAREYGQDLSRELQLLFIHGLLHLLGYGDETEDEQKMMRSKEQHYLQVP